MIDPLSTQSVVSALGQSSLDAIGAAVRDTRVDLSTSRCARDGRSNVLWAVELAETAADDDSFVHFEPHPSDTSMPTLPQIVESVEIEKNADSE